MSGMCRTVGSLFISVFVEGWFMLDAVDRLLVRGKDLAVPDSDLLTDCDLGIVKLPLSTICIYGSQFLPILNVQNGYPCVSKVSYETRRKFS